RLVHDLARGCILETRRLVRLMPCQKTQYSVSEPRIQPERLQRCDDGVTAKGRREPWDARIRVRSGSQLGRQQGEIGTRLVDPVIEKPRGAAQRRATATHGARVGTRIGGCRAEAFAAWTRLAVGTDLEIEFGVGAGQ